MPINNPDPGSAALHPVISERWSPREFSDRPIDSAQLRSLFEACPLGPSCFNEQPWRFVIATKAPNPAISPAFFLLLMEKNQQWATDAYLIGFSAGKKTFTQTGAPDRFGLYDTGAASAYLAIQATDSGSSHAHFMGGFGRPAGARTEFGDAGRFRHWRGVPFVVGYVKEGAPLPRPDRASRSRRSFSKPIGGNQPRF